MYRKSVTAARNAGNAPPPVSKDPVPPVEREREVPLATSAMDFCRDVLLSLIKLTGGNQTVAATEKELTAVLRKVEAKQYKSVLNVKDDVLNIWRSCLRCVLPAHFVVACCLQLMNLRTGC